MNEQTKSRLRIVAGVALVVAFVGGIGAADHYFPATGDSRFSENCGVDPIGTGGQWVDGCAQEQESVAYEHAAPAPEPVTQPTPAHLIVDTAGWDKIPSAITTNLEACNKERAASMADNNTFDLDELPPCLHDVYEFSLKDGEFHAKRGAASARMSLVTITNEDTGIQRHTFSCYIGDGNTLFMIAMYDVTLGGAWWYDSDGQFDLDPTHTYEFRVAVYRADSLDTAKHDATLDWAASAYQAMKLNNSK